MALIPFFAGARSILSMLLLVLTLPAVFSRWTPVAPVIVRAPELILAEALPPPVPPAPPTWEPVEGGVEWAEVLALRAEAAAMRAEALTAHREARVLRLSVIHSRCGAPTVFVHRA